MPETEKVLGESSVSRNWQTAIVTAPRKVLGLQKGDTLQWVLNDDGKVYVRRKLTK